MIRKFLIALVLIFVLVGAFYFFLDRPERTDAGRNPLLDLFSESADNAGGGLISNSEEFIADKAASIKESLQEKGGEVLGAFKDSVGGVIDSVGVKIGVQESGTDGAPAAGGDISILLVVKVGTKAYFSISNSDPSGEIEYEVDWGDGSVEKETLVGENAIISHYWDKDGEFSVIFKTLGTNAVSKLVKVFVTK